MSTIIQTNAIEACTHIATLIASAVQDTYLVSIKLHRPKTLVSAVTNINREQNLETDQPATYVGNVS